MQTFTLPASALERWAPIQQKLDFSGLPDPDYFGKVLAHAIKVDKLDSLLTGLETIVRLAGKDKGQLFPDFAPFSFTWAGGGWNGGLIFHGAHDGGGDGSFPTLSVCLNPVDGWSIHT